MNLSSRRSLAPVVALTALTSLSLAGPHAGSAPHAIATSSTPSPMPTVAAALELPREYVSAKATFVAHLDFGHLRGTTLWRIVEENSDDLDVELDDVRAELGFDPLEVIRSVTVYGTGGEPDAVILITTAAIDSLVERLEQEGELSSFEEDGLRLFAAEDSVGFVGEHGRGERVIVIAEDAGAVAAAASVVLGEARSLADASETALRAEPVTGSFLSLVARGTLPGMEDFAPASQVLGLAQGVQFDLGEAGGSVFAHLSIDTGSVETARDASDTVQGLLALGRIALRSSEEVPPELEELLYAVSVRTRGGAVSVDFEYSVSALVSLLEILEAEGR